MQKKHQQACFATFVLTVFLTLWRVLIAPQPSKYSGAYGALLIATAIAVVAILVWCGLKREELREVQGSSAMATTLASLFVGIMLTVFSVSTALRWFTKGEVPYPQKMLLNATDKFFLTGLIVSGIIGGIFFVCLAVRWQQAKSVMRGLFPLMALFPVFWSWFRLLRYETSHVSAVGTYRSLLDLGVLVAEMLFLLAFARFAANIQENPPRFLVGISLCTGLLCTSGVLTRFAMFCSQESIAFEESALISSPDIAFAVLAFVVAFGQAFASKDPQPLEQETEQESDESPREPLAVEDVINDILRRNN